MGVCSIYFFNTNAFTVDWCNLGKIIIFNTFCKTFKTSADVGIFKFYFMTGNSAFYIRFVNNYTRCHLCTLSSLPPTSYWHPPESLFFSVLPSLLKSIIPLRFSDRKPPLQQNCRFSFLNSNRAFWASSNRRFRAYPLPRKRTGTVTLHHLFITSSVNTRCWQNQHLCTSYQHLWTSLSTSVLSDAEQHPLICSIFLK